MPTAYTRGREMKPVTQIEYLMTLANLRTAEAALRDEPYPRLPALAGTLAVAADILKRLQGELIEALGPNLPTNRPPTHGDEG